MTMGKAQSISGERGEVVAGWSVAGEGEKTVAGRRGLVVQKMKGRGLQLPKGAGGCSPHRGEKDRFLGCLGFFFFLYFQGLISSPVFSNFPASSNFHPPLLFIVKAVW